MFGWLKKAAKPPSDDLPTEGGHDFLDCLRPGTDPIPAGVYAMWSPAPSEPHFASSAARKYIGQAYVAAAGIETFVLGFLLQRLGVVGEETGRVALPETVARFIVLGRDGRPFIVSASQEKGIRFHFHQSTDAEYRNQVLAGWVAYLAFLQRSVRLSGVAFDKPREQDPALWWATMERAVVAMEDSGEPVEAIGQMLLES